MDVSTLAIALGYTKKQVEQAKREGFRVQIEQDRSILETAGEEKIFYFLPKNPQKTKDGYDEFIYTNNDWEQVGVTDIDLSAYALKSEIPTKVSQLQNDSGYLTEHQDISGKADKATTLAGYGITDGQQKIDSNNKLSSDLVDDTNQTNKFVTTNEKSAWNGKYDKPSGGIPSTDLSSAVQTSLNKADSAIQDISGKEDTSNKVVSISAQSTDNQYPSAKCVYDIMVAVSKTDISSATVTLSANSFTYDGTSHVPSVTAVTLNGETLTAGTDYAVVSVPATNAGDYSLSVNGIGDYSGVVTANWTISKATPTISGDSSVSIVGIGESVSKTYTTDSDGAFSFTLSDNIAALSNVGGTVTIEATATGSATMTVSVAATANYTAATKTVSLEITEAQTGTVLGVLWDYSLSSPALTRLTPQSDPLGVVTDCPTTEPTACVGTTGGQSEFDNYMPWSDMERYNYVNGQIVDFTGYDNGETFVFIPEFWSKIVNDAEESKMYIYISSEELTGFTKHPGSGLYMSRYECNSNFLSASGTAPRITTNLGGFRTGITAIDNKHYQYDIHTYAALELLYIVEFANLNSQSMIGAGISSESAQTVGQTDVLTYHTGRVNGTADNVSAVQYRWIENLWGNVWNWIDGILIQDGLVYICNDRANYASSITNDYESTGLYTPTTSNWHKTDQDYNDCYIIPLTTGGSDSTYTCDYYYYGSELRGLFVGGCYDNGSNAGLFSWLGSYAPNGHSGDLGGRSILIIPTTNGGGS